MLWKFGAGTWKLHDIVCYCLHANLEFANRECLQGMYRQELEVDEQPNIQKELNASISMISVQYNSWYRPKQEV